MAKKKNKQVAPQQDSTEKAYNLHTQAIEDLISADEKNSPEVSETEIRKYRRDKLAFIPTFVKALFIKFWFNGAVCYFFFLGLSFYIANTLDTLVVLSIGMGLINDLLVKNILLYFDNGNGYSDWTLFPYKKYWTIIANLIYSFVLTFAVFFAYFGLNYLINGATSTAVFVEPLLFGIIYLLADLIFIGFKHLFIKIIADANAKLSGKK